MQVRLTGGILWLFGVKEKPAFAVRQRRSAGNSALVRQGAPGTENGDDDHRSEDNPFAALSEPDLS
jgi:hypothetical protein